jgi:hypothetical protein
VCNREEAARKEREEKAKLVAQYREAKRLKLEEQQVCAPAFTPLLWGVPIR